MEADAPWLAGTGAGGTSSKECGAPPPCFDCNICLEPAAEPVVTLCGHLYCWPCVHRWLRSDQPGAKNCPVCKAAVSEGRLLPLYGRGGAKCATARAPTRASVVGAREHSDGDVDLGNQQERYGYNQGTDYRSWAPVFHSNAGCVLGGLAVAMLPEAFRGGRSLPAPAPASRHSSRQQRRVENSLEQIWLFLAVFAVLCFLLF